MSDLRVLIIDDDQDFVDSVAEMLESHNYTTEVALNTRELKKVLKKGKHQVALIDVRFGALNGIDLIATIRESDPAILCVVVTAYAEIETSIAALREGAYDFLRKPFHPEELLATLERCAEKLRLEQELQTRNEQLLQAQKLETIGTLAGGVAHDFNNLLTPILGYTDMALSNLQPSDPLHDDLQHVLSGAYRAKELVEQILLFSRQEEKERKPLRLHLIVKEAIKLLRPSIPSTIEIRQRIDTSCGKVMADASQMHQVIVNLCTNAWQAMHEKGGVLTLELKQVEVDADTAKLHPDLDEAEYARLSVIDTGTGMDEQTLDRIFEPFFTSKGVERGTGLGLSVVYGIVHSHQGDILVHSEPGKGSKFQVYLPTVKAELATASKEPEAITGGEESILVVDDEEAITNVLKKMLDRLGYNVVVCNSSLEALKSFRKHSNKYDLVISDLTMPVMTGLDLAEQLQKIRSEFPIIIMTGYGEKVTDDIQNHCGIQKVVGKPIMIRELASEIRKIMDK